MRDREKTFFIPWWLNFSSWLSRLRRDHAYFMHCRESNVKNYVSIFLIVYLVDYKTFRSFRKTIICLQSSRSSDALSFRELRLNTNIVSSFVWIWSLVPREFVSHTFVQIEFQLSHFTTLSILYVRLHRHYLDTLIEGIKDNRNDTFQNRYFIRGYIIQWKNYPKTTWYDSHDFKSTFDYFN